MEEALLMFCVVAALLLAFVVMFAALPLPDYRPSPARRRRAARVDTRVSSDWH